MMWDQESQIVSNVHYILIFPLWLEPLLVAMMGFTSRGFERDIGVHLSCISCILELGELTNKMS